MKKFSCTIALLSLIVMSSFAQASHTIGGGDDTRFPPRGNRMAATHVSQQYPPLEPQPPAGRAKAKRGGGAMLAQASALPTAMTIPVPDAPAVVTTDTTHAQLIAQLTQPEPAGVQEQPQLAYPDPVAQTMAAPPAVAQVSSAPIMVAPVVAAAPVAQPERDDPQQEQANATPAATSTEVVDPTSNGWGASAWRKLIRGTFTLWNAGGKVQQDMFVDMTPQKLHEIISALDVQNLSASKLIGKRFINNTGNLNNPHYFRGYGVIIDFECGMLELKSKGFGNSDVAIAAWNPSEENPLRFLRALITNQHGNSVMEKGPVGTVQMCGTYPVIDMELKVFPQNTYVKLSVMRVENEYDDVEYNRVLQNILKKRIERALNPSEGTGE